MAIWTIIKLEKDILVLNIVTKFHKVVIKITRLRDRTTSKLMFFHEQRAITLEDICEIWPI